MVNSYISVNGVETYEFKVKGSEINAAPLCFGNVSKDPIVAKMKNTELYVSVNDFSVDYDSTGVDNILDIHK